MLSNSIVYLPSEPDLSMIECNWVLELVASFITCEILLKCGDSETWSGFSCFTILLLFWIPADWFPKFCPKLWIARFPACDPTKPKPCVCPKFWLCPKFWAWPIFWWDKLWPAKFCPRFPPTFCAPNPEFVPFASKILWEVSKLSFLGRTWAGCPKLVAL